MILLPFDFKRIDENKILLVNISGEFSIIDEENFKYIVNEDFEFIDTSILDDLITKQFISFEDNIELVEEMLSIKLRSRKNFLSDFTSLHMIVLTLNCNCLCDYCHASSKGIQNQKYFMNKETAKKVVDNIFKTPSMYIKIEFQGGEPLLNWDVLKYIVLYAEKVNEKYRKNVSFIICTNLLEIDDEKLSFIKQYNIDISTSCDGYKILHDKHRHSLICESAYDRFIENLEKSRTVLGIDKVTALLTVTKDNLYNLTDIIDHYIELKFNNIFIRALNPYGYAVQNKYDLDYSIDEFIMQYKKALNYIIELNKSGTYFVESYATLLLQRILTPFSTGFVDLQSPSGAGIGGAIYNFNGDVYPADEGRMLAESNDNIFCMGNVNKDDYYSMFTGTVIKDIVKNSCVESLPGCSSCAYKIYCGADPIRYYVECGDIVGKRYLSNFCKKNYSIIEEIFRYILNGDKDILKIFWSWINRVPCQKDENNDR